MDSLTASLDLLFLLVVVAFFPSSKYFSTPPGVEHPHTPLPNHSHPPSPPITPLVSPVAVPLITVTGAHERPSHKRKAVSFSLTPVDDLDVATMEQHRPRRPPTPYVSGLASPSQRKVELETPKMPGTPMDDSRLAVDTMGTQKGWLMS